MVCISVHVSQKSFISRLHTKRYDISSIITVLDPSRHRRVTDAVPPNRSFGGPRSVRS